MPHRPTLPQFVEDALSRAPLLMQEVLDGVAAMTQSPVPMLLPDVQRLVRLYRADLVSQFTRQLATLLRPQAPAARVPNRLATLSLVEDQAVTADVELARSVEAVRGAADHSLRELRAFTSALVGDLHVARDTNPLKPELFVRALWQALGDLPVSHRLQLAFLTCATAPLGKGLRLFYAAACTRLEDAGVTPSSYRTIVTGTSSRSWHRQNPPPDDLARLRQQLPAGPAALLPAGSDGLALLPRIFDTILQAGELPTDVQALMQRLQPVALRVAQQDPTTLDAYTHPIWELMDRIAFLAEVHAQPGDPQRQQLLAQAGQLVEAMAQEEQPDAASFRWALKRLTTQAQQQFDERLQAAADHIATLETLGPQFSPTTAEAGHSLPLEAHTLATVQSALLDSANSQVAAGAALVDERWLDTQQPGHWLRVFIDGHWRMLQLLWHADDLWLFAELAQPTRQTWALRQSALERLHAEGLLRELRPRSLVRRAAARLLRQIAQRG
ncbi:DUF1631 family protein [uncultured Aquincola sp.]|uniref:DUF1631 family protein n=1 Tax=uncultured Aquincola sp. TaxID=886556 RepID=UPI0032B22724